jgi:aminopeptidase YwaD
LPTPEKTGYDFLFWKDSEENQYEGGGTVSNFALTYTAEFEENTTAIHTLQEIEFSFYPNPAKNVLTVEVPNNLESINLQIVDLKGTVQFQTENYITNELIDISNFTSGCYLIKIGTDRKNITTKKLIIKK